MNNRRALFAATALVPLALVGCAADGTPSASTQKVFAQIQWLLPMVKMLALGISIAVPATSSVLSGVSPLLDLAADQFQKLEANMTASAARPIVEKVATYVGQALDLVQGQAAAAPTGSRLAALVPDLQTARQVFAALVAFASGVEAMPTARPGAMPRLLHR